MSDNWEDRLRNSPAVTTTAEAKAWEDRLKNKDLSPAPNPADSGGTLQFFNPFGQNVDTGISLGPSAANFWAAMGKGMTDLGRGAAQKLGGYSFDDAKETERLDAPLMQTKAGKIGDITGTAALALPAAFIPGANTYAGAAAIGATLGALAPATGWGNMAINTGAGGVMGPLGNLAGRGIAAGAGMVKSAVQPFFQGGRDRLVAETVRRFTPDPQRALAAIKADAGEILPGSLPNAAEATQLPGVAQLTKQVSSMPGTAAQQAFADRAAANSAARVAAMREVSGDQGQRAFFAANRDATADQLYGAARQAGIDPALLTPTRIADLAALQNRMPPEVLATARKIAKASGTPMTDATALDGMHWTKTALDGLITKESGPGGNSALLRAYSGLKNDLVASMDALSPEYAAARQTFADMSKPINQLDVGQALSDKLIPAINDFGGTANLRASGFTQALRNGDVVAQRATGMPRATMADVLEPQQMATVNALARDLARANNATNLAKAAGSDTVNNLVSQNIIRNTLGPLGLPESAAHNTLLASFLRPAQYLGGLAEPQLINQLGKTLLSPELFAEALKKSGRKGLLDRSTTGLIKYGAPVATSTMSGLLASPELTE